jgi:chromosome partitioning protein
LRSSDSRVTVCTGAGLRYEPWEGRDSGPPATEEARHHAPHRIVFANEKGGTGKSTTAVHVAVALAYQGARVAALDLDPRQRTLYRYFENRADTEHRRGIELPGARFDVFEGGSVDEMEAAVAALAEQAGDLSAAATS